MRQKAAVTIALLLLNMSAAVHASPNGGYSDSAQRSPVTEDGVVYEDSSQESPSTESSNAGHGDEQEESPATVSAVAGDINHDGKVTMADANAVVNYFLVSNKPEDIDTTAADVNGDGDITMADANQVVNMFLNSGKE